MFKKIKDRGRFIGFGVYLLVSLLIIVVSVKIFGWKFIFYNEAVDGFGNYPRLIWCLACVFLGFSMIAYRASMVSHENSAFPDYYLSYLLTLVLVASVDFAFFHIFQSTSNYLFYFLSGPLGFTFGYHADQAKINPLGLFSTLRPW